MDNRKLSLSIIVSSVLFTAVFYKQTLGLNALIFEIFVVAVLLWLGKLRLVSKESKIVFGLFIISTITAFINHSALSYTTNFLAYIFLIGYLSYPEARLVTTALGHTIMNFFKSNYYVISNIGKTNGKSSLVGKILRYTLVLLIPLSIILLFIYLYMVANPFFEEKVSGFWAFITKQLAFIFENIEIALIMVFVLGFLISSWTFYFIKEHFFEGVEKNLVEDLESKEMSRGGKNILHFELISAIFLIISLNIILVYVNFLDIRNVWFNFEWEGEYLKQFVHEGTWILIVSILLSIGITLYFFRQHLNYHPKIKQIKLLFNIWLAQNILLTLSVAIRNYWYIDNFALAYKRIAVFFFLLLTLYGIYTVIVKINTKKNANYLFRKNSFAILAILIISGFFSWDIIISKYNLKHYKTAFVHFNFLAQMSPKTLHILDMDYEQLKEIEEVQKPKFDIGRSYYMTAKEFKKRIDFDKERFIREFEEIHWLSWNPAQARTYRILKERSKEHDAFLEEYKELGQNIAKASFKALSSQVQESIKENGMAGTVDYCNIHALPITDSLSELYNATIKRTSMKIRNPENDRNSLEYDVLQIFKERFEKDKSPKPYVKQLNDSTIYFASPITMKPLCLYCHGTDQIPEDVRAMLNEKYPNDQATGYEDGDLRGMWSIQLKSKK